MNLKEKHILWLADYTTKEVPAGGAEITDYHILQAANILGLNITVCRPNDLRSNLLGSSDLVIFSNCYEFPKAARDKVMQDKPFIAYLHDSGRWGNVVKENPNILKKSLMNIFLSPLHRDCFKKYLDQTISVCIPPHIPYSFYDKGKERLNKVMFVGNIHEGKGVPQIIEYAKNNKEMIFDFYYQRGSNYLVKQLRSLPNCNLIGYVPKEKIHESYNLYKYFIHIPNHQESFGRAVGEAFLCGCKIIINDRVGATSFGWNYEEFRENTLKANFSFWETIENKSIS